MQRQTLIFTGLFALNMLIELVHKSIGVNAVHHASLFDGLASGSGTAKTVHSHLKEEGRGRGVSVENIADYRIFGYLHFISLHSVCLV